MAEFDRWAEYYDFIHLGLTGETEFYVAEAVRCGGEVLELGCGTGRICIPMAMSGVRVTGLDLSEGMLAVCREKLAAVGPVPGKLTLVHGDMRDFNLGVSFSRVIAAYRTFMHLLTPDDQMRCLASVRRHLAPEGRFILNVWAAKPSAIAGRIGGNGTNAEQHIGDYTVPGEGTRLTHYHSAEYDEHLQIIQERHRIEEYDASGRLVGSEILPLRRAWLTPREMEHLVRRCGFEIEGLFGDFRGEPFNAQSTEMIWILRSA